MIKAVIIGRPAKILPAGSIWYLNGDCLTWGQTYVDEESLNSQGFTAVATTLVNQISPLPEGFADELRELLKP